MKVSTAILLACMMLLAGCSPPEIPPGMALIEGDIGTSYDIVAFFQVSEYEFEKCAKAHATAVKHPRRVAEGFMREYYTLDAIGYTKGLRVKNFKFHGIVPKGTYVMAVPDKGYGSFLPIRVEGNVRMKYDDEAVEMTIP
jgi:hypothetical protein